MSDVRWMSPREVSTATRNLQEIQKYLDHPIPGGMIDPTAYKDTFLTPSECMTIARNIEAMERMYPSHNNYNYKYHNYSGGSLSGFLIFLGVVFIFYKVAGWIIMSM